MNAKEILINSEFVAPAQEGAQKINEMDTRFRGYDEMNQRVPNTKAFGLEGSRLKPLLQGKSIGKTMDR